MKKDDVQWYNTIKQDATLLKRFNDFKAMQIAEGYANRKAAQPWDPIIIKLEGEYDSSRRSMQGSWTKNGEV